MTISQMDGKSIEEQVREALAEEVDQTLDDQRTTITRVEIIPDPAVINVYAVRVTAQATYKGVTSEGHVEYLWFDEHKDLVDVQFTQWPPRTDYP